MKPRVAMEKELREIREEMARLGVTVRSVRACPREQVEAAESLKALKERAEILERRLK